MSINDLLSATINSLRRGSTGRREERCERTKATTSAGGVDEWTHKQVRRYFKRLQLDEYVGALRRAKVDGARLVALHNDNALYSTLGVTKIGHKKKLMVALRGLQEQGAWPSGNPTLCVAKHGPSVHNVVKVRKASGSVDYSDCSEEAQHNRVPALVEPLGLKKNESDKTERTKATVVPAPPDWAKLHRSRSSPDDSSSADADSAQQPKHSPRPATARPAARSPRGVHLPTDPIARSSPASTSPSQRWPPFGRDLSSSPPTFGSSVVPAVTAALHDTASHSSVVASMPVSPAGSHVFAPLQSHSLIFAASLGVTAPTASVHGGRGQSTGAVPTCTTLAFSQAFGGVAVKCVYGSDVSMIRFHAPGCASDGDDDSGDETSTESGDDSDSSDTENESESESDDDKKERKRMKEKKRKEKGEVDKLHFVDLRETIRATYGRALRVKYIDRDGDAINIDSDASLNYAFDDWRGQIYENGCTASTTTTTTTSWRLHLRDFEDESSSSSSSSASSSSSLSSSSSSLTLPSTISTTRTVE